MAHPKQKGGGWMEDFVRNGSNHGELVDDLFSGDFATAKGCLELLRRCCFVYWEVDDEHFAASTEALAGTNARQLLNENANSFGTGAELSACKVVARLVNGF